MSYVQFTILGNLGQDVELRELESGQKVATFSLAANERWTNKDGEKEERTHWFRITAWGKLAETADKYLSKGDQVLVTGSRIGSSAWIAEDGEARSTVELTARNITFTRTNGNRPPALTDEELEAQGEDIPF